MYAYEKKKKKRKSEKFKEKEIQEMCDNQLHNRNTPRYSAAAGQYFLISTIADSKKCSVLAFAALIKKELGMYGALIKKANIKQE
jgi:hypothetical protein